MRSVPIIDIGQADQSAIAHQLDAACRDTGFFYIVGHGIDTSLIAEIDRAAREFFTLPEDSKATMAMPVGGRAWRGWFPLGGEVTSGVPDRKEGIYFGQELGDDDPRVRAHTPLHGRNLFPKEVPALRDAVLAWMDALTDLGQRVMSCLSRGLGLPGDWFREHLTSEPTVLFRIFRYPPSPTNEERSGNWGVAEHTDYGLLTLLLQDECGGLQVKGRKGWIDAPPIPNSFVCNIGDMLERITNGRYISTPHRVLNTSGRDRLSFPFFFDPSWNARVESLPLGTDRSTATTAGARWDGRSVFDFEGTYGEYLIGKVSKVFPDLVPVI